MGIKLLTIISLANVFQDFLPGWDFVFFGWDCTVLVMSPNTRGDFGGACVVGMGVGRREGVASRESGYASW